MNTARIGPSIHIKGDITASEPLTIAGSVDGSIKVQGHPLTVAAGGRVLADVVADTIVVAGSINGSLTAGERIVLAATAAIDGNLRAPAVAMADGAMVRGRIETAVRNSPALRLAS